MYIVCDLHVHHTMQKGASSFKIHVHVVLVKCLALNAQFAHYSFHFVFHNQRGWQMIKGKPYDQNYFEEK